jgi:uncharacterized protein YvpB
VLFERLRLRRLSLLLFAGTLLPLAIAAETGWLDVPYVRQVKAGCGSAAIAMVMQYWARYEPRLDALAADADRIHKHLPPSKRGLAGQALKGYLEENGFSAYVFDGELSDLRNHLEKGRPVVVCLALRGPRAPLHYVVIVGLGDGLVVMNDPARGKVVREDLDSFVRAWKITGHWALLAVPRQET